MRILECFSFYRKIRCLCKQILLRHEVVQHNVFSWQSWQFPLRSATKGMAKMPLTRRRVQNPWIGGFWNEKEDAFITTNSRWVILAGANDCLCTKCAK